LFLQYSNPFRVFQNPERTLKGFGYCSKQTCFRFSRTPQEFDYCSKNPPHKPTINLEEVGLFWSNPFRVFVFLGHSVVAAILKPPENRDRLYRVFFNLEEVGLL